MSERGQTQGRLNAGDQGNVGEAPGELTYRDIAAQFTKSLLEYERPPEPEKDELRCDDMCQDDETMNDAHKGR